MNFIDTPGYGNNYSIQEWYKMIKEYTFRKVKFIRVSGIKIYSFTNIKLQKEIEREDF